MAESTWLLFFNSLLNTDGNVDMIIYSISFSKSALSEYS